MTDAARIYRFAPTARACKVPVAGNVCRTVPGKGSTTPFSFAPLRGYRTSSYMSMIFPGRSPFFLKRTKKAAVLAALLYILLPFAAVAEKAAQKAPPFRLPDAKGAVLALEDFKGHVLLINFWATWCVSCREELIELDHLYRTYRDAGLVVIAISVDTSAARVAAFLKKKPVGFPVLTDTTGDVADAYRFSGLPAAFLIGRDGVIERRYRVSGKELLSLYEKDIEDLLKRK
jgi:peroxiredoxin